jgi:succinate dehydrogenase flavin-adding protein (antitoxin of CptAB toxin-antitoxin module)
MVTNLFDDMPADEISKLMKLMRLRDQLLCQILYGIREADKTADMTLVEELEMLTGEAKLVSREIHDILENRGDYAKDNEGEK